MNEESTNENQSVVEGILRQENDRLRQELSLLKQAVGGGTDHPLYQAFDDAVTQATKGKGVRHGGEATPFMEQPIFQVSKHTGVGGLIFQMVKKAQEACSKDDQEAFERELLGALVYGGAAYLYVKDHGFKGVLK